MTKKKRKKKNVCTCIVCCQKGTSYSLRFGVRMIIIKMMHMCAIYIYSHILKSEIFIKFHRIEMKMIKIRDIDGRWLLYHYSIIMPTSCQNVRKLFSTSICIDVAILAKYIERSEPYLRTLDEVDSPK